MKVEVEKEEEQSVAVKEQCFPAMMVVVVRIYLRWGQVLHPLNSLPCFYNSIFRIVLSFSKKELFAENEFVVGAKVQSVGVVNNIKKFCR